jgi:hypothetical protein
MVDILFSKDKWGLKRPKLLISVTGGTHFLYNKSTMRDYFSKGLYKAVVKTSGLILLFSRSKKKEDLCIN